MTDSQKVLSIDELMEFAGNKTGRVRYEGDDGCIDFNWVPNQSKNLLVFFTAAVKRTPEQKLPAFSGTSFVGKVDANILMISDPSLELNDNLTLAWYAGNEKLKLQPILGRILVDFSVKFGKNKTILYGGSGGGFASIYYSTYIPKAIAVAANPQTNILKYYKRLVKKYFDICFPNYSQIGKELYDTDVEYDVCDLFSRSESNLIYLQNLDDTFHIENHLVPFLESQGHKYIEQDKTTVNNLSDRLTVVYGKGWGEGHSPPPKQLVFCLLNLLCKGLEPTSIEFKETLERL